MHQRRAKIICTLGPATSDLSLLRQLVEAGMDIARLNFSHGTHEDHAAAIARIRAVEKELGRPIAILQDLQGPKIRTGAMPEGGVELRDGDEFTITTEDIDRGDATRVSTVYQALPRDVHEGQTILLDDGYLALTIESVHGSEIRTRIAKGGVLRSNKGIIVPGAAISAPPLSEKDIEDLRFGLEAGVDAVALSFVRSERDIIELRTAMKLFGRTVPVIAKIERDEGYTDIEDIIAEADGIMVARGDLGVEMPAEQVPVLQKHIIRRCNYFGKPVITATQMLESMIAHPRPTRAEASDVANAVLDGTDCVMLSGETSVGKYPLDAVAYMDRIVRTIEADNAAGGSGRMGSGSAGGGRTGSGRGGLDIRQGIGSHDIPEDDDRNIADAIGRASCVIAEQIGAAAIVSLTTSGGTARVIAKYRPTVPILALTDSARTMRALLLTWGVTPVLIPSLESIDFDLEALRPHLLATGLVAKGQRVVYSAGSPLQKRVTTNMLEVHTL
ncbi:MAG: pyruvate kinase [Bacteroidota bacterium]|jgi:pyruvate kinase|nr:pyruvate kinase [Bacteroidota bacterium]